MKKYKSVIVALACIIGLSSFSIVKADSPLYYYYCNNTSDTISVTYIICWASGGPFPGTHKVTMQPNQCASMQMPNNDTSTYWVASLSVDDQSTGKSYFNNNSNCVNPGCVVGGEDTSSNLTIITKLGNGELVCTPSIKSYSAPKKK